MTYNQNERANAKRRLKDKKIELLKPSSGDYIDKDSQGFKLQSLEPVCPSVWAYYRHLTGREMYTNNTTIPRENVMFVINWRRDISTRNVVRFRGELFDIVRVDDFQGYKSDIVLYCKNREVAQNG